MNLLILLCLVNLAALTTAAPNYFIPFQDKPHYDLNDAENLFEQFQRKYHKTYKDAHDKQIHFEMFKKSLAIVNALNVDPEQAGAVFDINPDSDRTEKELWYRFHGLIW